jgi:hypothetical protein
MVDASGLAQATRLDEFHHFVQAGRLAAGCHPPLL